MTVVSLVVLSLVRFFDKRSAIRVFSTWLLTVKGSEKSACRLSAGPKIWLPTVSRQGAGGRGDALQVTAP